MSNTKYTVIDTRQIIKGHVNKVIKKLKEDRAKLVANLREERKHKTFERKLTTRYNRVVQQMKEETKKHIMKHKLIPYIRPEIIQIQEWNKDTKLINWWSEWQVEDGLPNKIWNNEVGEWCAEHRKHDNEIVRDLCKYSLIALKERTTESLIDLTKVRAS